MPPRRSLVIVLCLAVAVTAGALPGIAESDFHITVHGSVDTPDRTVSFEGTEYAVSAVAKAPPDDPLLVHVATPDVDGLVYRVYLYNADRQIVDSKRGTEPTRFQFDLTGLPPGSYMLAVQYQGGFEAIHPVVVTGYAVTVDAPATISGGSSFDVAVTVTPTQLSGRPDRVAVALTNESTTVRANATWQGEGVYTARVPTRSLAAGSYKLYAIAQGDREVFGRAELLGMSDTVPLAIKEAAGNETTAATRTPAEQPTPPAPATEASPPARPTTANVITPVGDRDTTTTSGQAGFGAIGVLTAVLVLAARSRLRP